MLPEQLKAAGDEWITVEEGAVAGGNSNAGRRSTGSAHRYSCRKHERKGRDHRSPPCMSCGTATSFVQNHKGENGGVVGRSGLGPTSNEFHGGGSGKELAEIAAAVPRESLGEHEVTPIQSGFSTLHHCRGDSCRPFHSKRRQPAPVERLERQLRLLSLFPVSLSVARHQNDDTRAEVFV